MIAVRIRSTRCFLHSFKEGILSRLAHDLRLEVTRVELELGEDGLPRRARFFPDSIVLVGKMENGALQAEAFPRADREKISKSLRDDVLETARYPEIAFSFEAIEPAGDGYRVRGALTLHGRTRPLETTSRREGDVQIAEIVLHQPAWGITPFSAMLGALKVKPDVVVRVEMTIEPG